MFHWSITLQNTFETFNNTSVQKLLTLIFNPIREHITILPLCKRHKLPTFPFRSFPAFHFLPFLHLFLKVGRIFEWFSLNIAPQPLLWIRVLWETMSSRNCMWWKDNRCPCHIENSPLVCRANPVGIPSHKISRKLTADDFCERYNSGVTRRVLKTC